MHHVTPHLSLLAGDRLLHEAAALAVPSLEAQPARPGEMPECLFVVLDIAAAHKTAKEVARTGIPVPLWLRLAVEGARHVAAVAATLVINRTRLEVGLDGAAEKGAGAPELLYSRRQLEYARLLRTAAIHSGRQRALVGRRVEVAAPDQILTAWALDAAGAGVGLDEVVSEYVLEAPTDIVKWEAAAAESGRGLGEWIYAGALALTAR